MRCISLWQPWATLWLLSDPDEKVFETRHWYTAIRGPLLVHAAKKNDREIQDFIHSSGCTRALLRHGFRADDEPGLHLTFGAIIGEVDLIGCSRMDRMPEPSERERSFGNWEPERYAWERGSRPHLYRTPIPYRGAQGFFDVPESLVQGAGHAPPQRPSLRFWRSGEMN